MHYGAGIGARIAPVRAMTESRITLAREAGLFDWPSGPIAVFAAGKGPEALTEVPKDRTTVVSKFRPEYEKLESAGWRVTPEAPDAADLSIVFLPRARGVARSRIAEAAGLTRGPVVVDGQKTDGIEGILRDLRANAAGNS